MVVQSTILSPSSMAVRINWPQRQFDNVNIVIKDVVTHGQLLGFVDRRPPAARNLSISIDNVTVETVGTPAVVVGSGGGYDGLWLHISEVTLTSWNATAAVLCFIGGTGFMLHSLVSIVDVSVRSAAAPRSSTSQTSVQIIVDIQTHLALHSTVSVTGVVVNSTLLQNTPATTLIFLSVHVHNSSAICLARCVLELNALMGSNISMTLLDLTSHIANVSRMSSVAAKVGNVTMHVTTASSAVVARMMHVHGSHNVSIVIGAACVLICASTAVAPEASDVGFFRAVGLHVASGMVSSNVTIEEVPSMRLGGSRETTTATPAASVTAFESTDHVVDTVVTVVVQDAEVKKKYGRSESKQDLANTSSAVSMFYVTGMWSNVTAKVTTANHQTSASSSSLCNLTSSQAPSSLHTIVACGAVCSLNHRSVVSVHGLAGVRTIIGPIPWDRSAPLPNVSASDSTLTISQVSFFPASSLLRGGILQLRNLFINISISAFMVSDDWMSILPPLSHLPIGDSYVHVVVSVESALRLYSERFVNGGALQFFRIGPAWLSQTDVYAASIPESNVSIRAERRHVSCYMSATLSASRSYDSQTPSAYATSTISFTWPSSLTTSRGTQSAPRTLSGGTLTISPSATFPTYRSASSLPSVSATLPPPHAAQDAPAASLTSGSVAAAGLAAAVGSGVLGDAAALAALTMVSCGGRDWRSNAGSPQRFVMSPLYDYGPTASALGNLGGGVGVLALHLCVARAVAVFRLRRGGGAGSSAAASMAAAAATVRFPSASYRVGVFLCSGAMFATGHLARSASSAPLETVPVIVGVVACVCAAAAFSLRFAVRELRATVTVRRAAAPPRVVLPRAVLRVLLPSATWGPTGVVRRYSALFSSVGSARHIGLHHALQWHGAVFSLVAALPFAGSVCALQYAALCAWCMVPVVLVAVRGMALLRLPLSNYLTVASKLCTVCVLIASALRDEGVDGAIFVAEVLTILLTVISVFGTLGTVCSYAVERHCEARCESDGQGALCGSGSSSVPCRSIGLAVLCHDVYTSAVADDSLLRASVHCENLAEVPSFVWDNRLDRLARLLQCIAKQQQHECMVGCSKDLVVVFPTQHVSPLL